MTAPGGGPAATDVLNELRQALGEMLGAERRLRSRDKVTVDGLTFAQIRALMCLKDKEAATAGELARFADLNPASMTAMLDHLADAGVIVRERSVSDRRVVNVSLTAHGRALVEKRRTAWEARWRDALGGLPEADLAAAAHVMRAVAAIFDQTGPQDR